MSKIAKKRTTKPTTKRAAKKTSDKSLVAVKASAKKGSAKPKALKRQRIGIFGGSFNPFHIGHLGSLETVAREMKLKKIFVVPSYQSPGKPFLDSPTPEERLEMTTAALEEYGDIAQVDSQEVERQGVSYTIDTLQSYIAKYGSENIFLIIGADVFLSFDQWRDFDQILESCNLVVTTRPGSIIPFQKENLASGLQPLIEEIDVHGAKLTTGRTISFLPIQDIDVSGTEIRKCLRVGLKVDRFLSFPVEDYIREKGLYQSGGVKISDYEEFTKFCSSVLSDKKGINLRAYDLRSLQAPSEFALVASGTSTRHTAALGENVVEEVKKRYGVLPQSIEGAGEGRWVLLDYGSLIIHLFYDYVRSEYRLENLWSKGVELQVHQ